MKFFIDTANLDEIRAAHEWGLCDGVTTNPSLIAKTGRPVASVIKDIAAIVAGPISCEVLGTDFHSMMAEAHDIAGYGPNLVVKLPLTSAGLQAVAACSREGIATNVTLCFSAAQALLAAKAGATYISPFVGRLDDVGHEGMALIREIRTIYLNYKFATQILVASTRSPLHIRDAALAGADVATIPFQVMGQLIRHPLTDLGLARFLEDAKAIPRV